MFVQTYTAGVQPRSVWGECKLARAEKPLLKMVACRLCSCGCSSRPTFARSGMRSSEPMTNIIELRTHARHHKTAGSEAERAAVVADLVALSAGIKEAIEK